jgi:hypothetical protein
MFVIQEFANYVKGNVVIVLRAHKMSRFTSKCIDFKILALSMMAHNSYISTRESQLIGHKWK